MEGLDTLTVLVVDDEADLRDLLRELLKAQGFEKILAAADGDVAIRMLSEENIDLVI